MSIIEIFLEISGTTDQNPVFCAQCSMIHVPVILVTLALVELKIFLEREVRKIFKLERSFQLNDLPLINKNL